MFIGMFIAVILFLDTLFQIFFILEETIRHKGSHLTAQQSKSVLHVC